MSRGDRFSGYKSDPYSRSSSPLGANDDFVATSDDSDASLISLFKRLLSTKFTVFGEKKDTAATSDDTEASLISLIKRLLGKIRVTNNRIDVNADIPSIGQPTDIPADSDNMNATLIAIVKRISGKIPLTNNRIDVNAGVDALGKIDDAAASTDTEDATAIAYLKRISGKIPSLEALGTIIDAPAATDTEDATAIALMKRVLVRMSELLSSDEQFVKYPISGTAMVTTTTDSQIIAAQEESIYLNKIIIANDTPTQTLVDIKIPERTLVTVLSPANSNQAFDLDTAIDCGTEGIIAANRTSATTFINLFGYTSSEVIGGGDGNLGNTITLTYSTDGDVNGVFYYIGSLDQDNWSNPYTANLINITMSSAYSSAHNNPQFLVDRTINSLIATSNVPNSFYEIDLRTYQLILNYYSLRARNDSTANPKNWKIEGKKNGYWEILHQVSDNPLSANQWASFPVDTTSAYSIFRVTQTGLSTSYDNVFCIGELEFYGTLTPIET